VTILVDDDSAAKRYDLPKEWRIIKTGERRWWWPPVKRVIPGSLDLRLRLLSDYCMRILKNERPDAVLALLGTNSILAAHISKKLRSPLSVVVHDRWQVWHKYGGADKFLTDNLALSVLEHASRVWPVSEEMGDYHKIPEGNNGGFAAWKEGFAQHPVVAFAGSYHSPQASAIRAAAEELQKLGGELLIVTRKRDLIEKEAGKHSNIRYVEPFSKNEELIAFLRDNASAVLIAGSIDTRAAGWQLSFPSRLVEFVQTGLPVIISGMPGTALANWAEKHQWRGYVSADDHTGLEKLLEQMKGPGTWTAMAEQSRAVALGEFNPERIQAQFEGELVTA
jgi:glycosyltransferase involved in cell wall biosynthesis